MDGNSMLARLDEKRVIDDRCDCVLQNNAGATDPRTRMPAGMIL